MISREGRRIDMMKFNVGNKEYKIKYGYKPTLKEHIITKLLEVAKNNGGEKADAIENLLLFIPELLLVGLQVYHKDEFGYDYDTKYGKQEQLDKVFDLIDEYSSQDGADLLQLFEGMQEEMKTDSFLSNLLGEGQKAETAETAVEAKDKEQ
jgi:hypothetical protein